MIDAIISLPEKMFLNTSIPVCVVVFNKAKVSDDILFISAEKLFAKNGKQNVMTDEHIKRIAETYWNRKSVDKFASLVSLSKIKENEYNLNIPRYVDTYEPEELPPLSEITQDIIKCNLNINKATNDLLQMLQELCGDCSADETPAEMWDISIIYDGKVMLPISTAEGLMFIDRVYLNPFVDMPNETMALALRKDFKGTPYFAVKFGMIAYGFICAYEIVDEDFVRQLKSL